MSHDRIIISSGLDGVWSVACECGQVWTVRDLSEAKDEEIARLRAALDIERLASLIHDEWVSWSKELAAKEKLLGSERVERWKSLWVPYAELSETMKERDREWARKVRGYEESKSARKQTSASMDAQEQVSL